MQMKTSSKLCSSPSIDPLRAHFQALPGVK